MPNTHKEQAIRIWKKLIEVAKTERTITYKELGQAVGMHYRAFTPPLDIIQYYCRDNALPPLTILVVLSTTHQPSTGFVTAQPEEYPQKQAEVFRFEWAKHTQRFVSEMEKG